MTLSTPATPSRRRVGTSLARSLAAAGLGAVLALTAVVPPASSTVAAARTNNQVPPAEGLRMVHANIKTGMTQARFNADLGRVYAAEPDVISFNEVHLKRDAQLTPAGSGYQLWRDNANRYRGETPVAWRTDRWSPISQGNRMLSNWRGVPPGKKVELGRRFANWVTLTSVDGRTLSVVSVHLAPATKGMPDLRRPAVERLVGLVDELAVHGPVLVGGDFNVHYRSRIYPQDLFEAGQMIPTYETLGTTFPTGDHFGATIDYIFNRGEGQLLATAHRAVELKSDHDLVVADFAWQVDAPATTSTVTNDPSGTFAERRRSARALVTAIDAVPAGGQIQAFAADLRHEGLQRALRDAATRGVAVRYLTRSGTLTPRESGLLRHIARLPRHLGSTVVACERACRVQWRQSGLARGVVLVAPAPQEAPILRLDVSRNLNARLVSSTSSVVSYTGQFALDEAVRLMPVF